MKKSIVAVKQWGQRIGVGLMTLNYAPALFADNWFPKSLMPMTSVTVTKA